MFGRDGMKHFRNKAFTYMNQA